MLKMHKCPECDYESAYSWNLKKHLKIHQKPVEIKPEHQTGCQFCFREFSTVFNRKRHETTCKSRNIVETKESKNVSEMGQFVTSEGCFVTGEGCFVTGEGCFVTGEGCFVTEEGCFVTAPGSSEKLEKYECSLCYKVLSCKKTLMKHVAVCTGLGDPLMCPKCRVILPNRTAKMRHVKDCDGTGNEQAVIPIEPSSQQVAIPTTPSKNEGHVTGTINNLNHVNTANINNNTVQMNLNLHINSFGQEDLSKVLTPEFIDASLQMLNGKGIYNMVKNVHFDPDTPENRNIRLGSSKRKTLEVKEDDGWHIRANCDILEILITKYKSILMQRSLEPDFKDNLKHSSDFIQIQQDLLSFDRKMNPTGYYACAHKILALIEDLERTEKNQ